MLHSLRLGFATNSSSAHSIVLHSDPRFLGMINGDTIDSASGMGRDHFSFVDREAKMAYLIWAHDQSGRFQGSAHQMLALAAKMPDMAGANLERLRAMVASFETESLASDVLCPRGVDIALWFRFMANAPVAIHGYDDNANPSWQGVVAKDHGAIELSSMRIRQDGDAIVGFNPQNGLKFRWSESSYTKSRVPELVDLKITDFCTWGCTFCYQGSTKEGGHAPWESMDATMRALANAGVFEVAVGGGEPIEHPDFAKLITLGAKLGITVNFTTYGVEWATPEHPVIMAMKKAYWSGGIGVSVHSLKDVDKVEDLANRLSKAGVWQAQVMAQTVVGATPMKATDAIVARCIEADRPVLLLGYKTTGRGADFRPRGFSDDALRAVLERAKAAVAREPEENEWGGLDTKRFSLSVDTAFLDAHGTLLDEVGVPKVLRTSPEGKFSMYVDAVKGLASPSSYATPEASVTWDPQNLTGIFARF